MRRDVNALLNTSEQINIAKDQWAIMKQGFAYDLMIGGVVLDLLFEDFNTSVTTDKSILYYLTDYVVNKGL